MSETKTPCARCGTMLSAAQTMCPTCGQMLERSSGSELVGKLLLETYFVDAVLAQGGMSVVYRGHHRLTDQPVAIKVLPPELSVHTSLKQRFLEEARALAKLDHPGIVRLYNFGEDHGRLCLVMQLVEGRTLEELIDEQAMAWPDVARIGRAVLSALEAAHASGVVHRDVKPSNILLRGDDVFVTDFGIARDVQSSQRLTETGQTMGTARYMSPEQVRGLVVDHRSDLYSLAVVMYEALVGEAPFEAQAHFDVMMKHLTEPPMPPSARGVILPPAGETLILKALAKDPAQRFATAAEMQSVLSETSPPGAVFGVSSSGPSSAKAHLSRGSQGEPTVATGVIALEIAEAAAHRRKFSLFVASGALLLVAAVLLFWRFGTSASSGGPSDDSAGSNVVATPLATTGAASVAAALPHRVAAALEIQSSESLSDPPVRLMIAARAKKSFPTSAKEIADRWRAVRKQVTELLVKAPPPPTSPVASDAIPSAPVVSPITAADLNAIKLQPLIVVKLQSDLLADATKWPGWTIGQGARFDSRYIPRSRDAVATLYVADDAPKAKTELDRQIALHICIGLMPSGDLCLKVADEVSLPSGQSSGSATGSPGKNR